MSRTASRDAVLWQWVFLLLAIGQPVAIGVSSVVGSSFSDITPQDPVIVPVGPAFAIWGLIVTLTLIYAVWQAFSRIDLAGTAAIAAPMTLTAAGFSCWLAVASIPALTFITLPVFAAMGFGLVLAARASRSAALTTWPRAARGVLWGMLGTYGGWTAIALWVNLATLLADVGAPVRGQWGTTWQLLITAAAAGTAVLLLTGARRTRRTLTVVLGATMAYALAFAALGAGTRDAVVPAAAAGILAVTVVASTVILARRVSPTR